MVSPSQPLGQFQSETFGPSTSTLHLSAGSSPLSGAFFLPPLIIPFSHLYLCITALSFDFHRADLDLNISYMYRQNPKHRQRQSYEKVFPLVFFVLCVQKIESLHS